MRQLSLLSIVVLLSYSSLAFSEDENVTKISQQKILSSLNGRFVFGQISEYRRDQFLLDTQTGRLWRVTSDKDDKQPKLEPIPYVQIFGNEAYAPDPLSDVESYRKMTRKKTPE